MEKKINNPYYTKKNGGVMRTIKFRGKRVDGGGWIEGFAVIVGEKAYIIKDIGGFYWEVDPETVGQFTGLHDKNGREIYEGDIVLIDGLECRISFSVRLGSWRIDGENSDRFISSTFHYQYADQCEIIGKIHETRKE